MIAFEKLGVLGEDTDFADRIVMYDTASGDVLPATEVDIKEMARKAVDNLIDKIKGIKGRESVSIIEGHLVEKDSVKNLVL